jgi:hypothetical protein
VAGVISGFATKKYPDGFNQVEVIDADTDDIVSVKGFMVDLDGTLSVRFEGDAATILLPVNKGVVYPGSVAEVDITGSTTVTKVYLLRYAPL